VTRFSSEPVGILCCSEQSPPGPTLRQAIAAPGDPSIHANANYVLAAPPSAPRKVLTETPGAGQSESGGGGHGQLDALVAEVRGLRREVRDDRDRAAAAEERLRCEMERTRRGAEAAAAAAEAAAAKAVAAAAAGRETQTQPSAAATGRAQAGAKLVASAEVPPAGTAATRAVEATSTGSLEEKQAMLRQRKAGPDLFPPDGSST